MTNDNSVECNDVYANRLGGIGGISDLGSNVMVDPLFCDISHDDVHVRQGAVVIALPGCGNTV